MCEIWKKNKTENLTCWIKCSVIKAIQLKFSQIVTKIEQIRQYNHTRLFVLVCYTRSSAVIQTNLDCYTSQLKYIFWLDKNVLFVMGQN